MARKPTTYWDYIKVEQLLGLQSGLDADDSGLSNDEVLFITVHQIDELWFKLVLRELVAIRDLFAQDPVPEQSLASAVRGIHRTATLMKNVSAHFELMETMTTRDYLGFRDKLSPASGFQSAQLREIEILMGLSDDKRIPFGHEKSYMQALRTADGSPSPALRRVQARLEDRPTLKETIDEWLFRTPIQGSTPSDAGDEEVVRGFLDDYLQAQARELQKTIEDAIASAFTPEDADRLRERFEREMQNARHFLMARDVPAAEQSRARRIRAALIFIESYRELPLLAWPREVVDGVVALEQAFLIFRQRHARMVERVIGRRTGTGGSAGVDYLDETALQYRVFTEAWAVRTLLLKRDALPDVRNPNLYGFAGGE